ncbi:hypothetical protein CDD83_10297 [Cordyceps sp. RAO-2017]|nr:hypothetical protein CDD83_10297 [Cordyceps sp. RAO-2017]
MRRALLALGMASSPDKPPFAQAAQFTRGALARSDLLDVADPLPQFRAWYADAQAAHARFPDEVKVKQVGEVKVKPVGEVKVKQVGKVKVKPVRQAKVKQARQPKVKPELDGSGFVIYSNLATSRKAADLAANPRAALVFHWPALQRQVRVEGRAERVGRDQAQRYFDSRLRASRIGAWASRQSAVLPPEEAVEADDGRARLERHVAEAERRFDGLDRVPLPDHWGGLRIVPDAVEFWQGRLGRLHDRFLYQWDAEAGRWALSRLSP